MAWRRWGRGRPVVLLHGGSGSWMHWLRTVPVLAASREVWAPDLPGCGESDVPPEPVTLQSFAAQVEQGLRQLPCDLDGLDMVGFSMGAGVSVVLARRLEGRLRHLVLAGANFVDEPLKLRTDLVSARRIGNGEERRRAFRHNLQVMMIAHSQNIDELALDIYSFDAMRRRYARRGMGSARVIRPELPLIRLKGRFTVISGADDQVIGHTAAAQAQALHGLVPEARYIAIPDSGHWVMYEGATAFNEALLRDALS
jgi:pimeloyl-ACP methyl ester carboxylesterase